jgi:pimeloyl-ACP methyl ester carboxylesterase
MGEPLVARGAARDGGSLIAMREHTVSVWRDRIRMRVLCQGTGPAVVFFHGPWGLTWDPFLDELARSFTVYAPEHPGTTPGQADDIYQLDNLWDLVLCYDELLEALGLRGTGFVGHSFGAMMACEIAAAYPGRARRLALIDPLGFWRDDAPITNWMLLSPGELPGYVFHDPEGEAARRMFGSAKDGEEAAVMARVQLTWAMGTTGKFIWPLPDKGLKKRIHRVQAPTLLIWGSEDRLVPPVYAEEFARHIDGARAETIDHTGHAPHLEQPKTVVRLLHDFLTR